MAKVTDNEITQLNHRLDQVMGSLAQINLKLTDLEKNQIKLEGKIDNINTRLDTYKPAFDKIPELAEKVGELKGWRAISLVIFSGFITSIYW